ncbi:hypothetical protein CNY67_14240 [Desulfovibrio sp. G11]|nr:hypothetical protein CNY67_14240 [Desulfovibrio sp. G11]
MPADGRKQKTVIHTRLACRNHVCKNGKNDVTASEYPKTCFEQSEKCSRERVPAMPPGSLGASVRLAEPAG